MKEKAKHDSSGFSPVLFLMLWIAGHAGSWVLAILANKILSWLRIYIQSDLALGLLIALGTGLPSAIVQMVLVERGLKKSMRGWILVSAFGWFLSGVAFAVAWSALRWQLVMIPQPDNLFPRLMFLPLFVPVALFQWAWLRKKVKGAGLWVLAALAGALLFAIPGGGTSLIGIYHPDMWRDYVLMGLAALLYSGTTGATMLYLWTQQREKDKKAVNSVQQSDDAGNRLERLTDTVEPADDLADSPSTVARKGTS